MQDIRDLLLNLLVQHSYRKQKVVLASGKESDFFIDCKQTALKAQGHLWIGKLMLQAASNFAKKPRAVAGVELGGCSLASAVSTVSALEGHPIDAIYVRKALKDHGAIKWLEGAQELKPADPIVVLEDVITTAGSTLKAVEKIRAHGFDVVGVVALVDRLEGGTQALAQADLPFIPIYTREDFC